MRLALLLGLVLTTVHCASVTVPTARPRLSDAECTAAGQDAFDVLAHDVNLAVTLAPASLTGDGAITLKARRTTDLLVLDASELTVSQVTPAAEFRSSADAKHLCIRLSGPVTSGESVTVHIAWAARVDRETPRFFAHHVWAGYLTSAWMPTIQDSAARATLKLQIAAPVGLSVAASGTRQSAHSFTVDRPVPPFLFAFAVGEFDESTRTVDDISLRALAPHGADVQHVLAVTAEMMHFYTERFGPFPGPEYTQVFVEGDAAQEAAGMALLGVEALDDLKKDPTDDWLLSHELAHQWFAWSIACKSFSDFWLNEGFATFLVGAMKEHRFGAASLAKEISHWQDRSHRATARNKEAPVSLGASVITESQLQDRGVTYFRGALVLQKLRTQFGDDTFWKSLRRYVNARAGKSATTEDLRAAFELETGRNLSEFFSTWVYSPAPTL